MTENSTPGPSYRFFGLCLIVSSIASVAVMALHPTGRQLLTPGRLEIMTRVNIAVHSLALIALPFSFIGALGVSRRLRSAPNLALTALVVYGFSTVAVMIAGAVSGLVGASLAYRMAGSPPDQGNMLHMLFHFGGDLNQAFARIFVVGAGLAILFWSWAMLRVRAFGRGLAIYGCIFGGLSVIAVASGRLPLDVHGFGAVALGQAIWFITVGAEMFKPRDAQ